MSKTSSKSNDLIADLIIEECLRLGVRSFVLSPGSRNTPLTLAVARAAQAQSFLHYDERSAAFFALGQAKASRNPVVLICTSGSAVANYLPAVIEASQSRIPLILITADRPPELLDCGANQAIDQHKIFGAYTRWQATLPCPEEDLPASLVLTTIDQALYQACAAPAGPVHLNCMFREPLSRTPAESEAAELPHPLPAWRDSNRPYTTWRSAARGLTTQDKRAVIERLKATKKGLLVIGALPNPRTISAVQALAQALQWPVFADINSGLRIGARIPSAVPYYDQLLLSKKTWAQYTPDTILHLGASLTSKRLLTALARRTPEYYLVADHPWRQDPNHSLTGRFEADLEEFCAWLAPMAHSLGLAPWGQKLSAASEHLDRKIETWLEEHPQLSEIHVARSVSQHKALGAPLFLGNSMPVRDMNRYADAKGVAGPVWANRGASGIDGLVATAAGVAACDENPTTAVIGDLSLIHDLNALALMRDSRVRLVLIVINNNGGGIFSFLPVAAQKELFEPYFGTPHNLDFAHAVQTFGLPFHRPKTLDDFKACYSKALLQKTSCVIEVATDRQENFELHEALQAHLKSSADAFFDA